MYAEAPPLQADFRYRETDLYMRYQKIAVGASRTLDVESDR